jgi:hypothetical protein
MRIEDLKEKPEFDTDEHFDNAIKELMETEDDPKGEESEKEEQQEEDKEEDKKEDEDKGEDKNEEQKKEPDILGKTPEEIDAIINQRTAEAVKKHEETLRDYYESKENETTINTHIGQIEYAYGQYENAVKAIDVMFNNGEITAEQYREAVNIAMNEMNTLRYNHSYLQQQNQQVNIPRTKRGNDEFFQKLQTEVPEFKDPIVQKYASSLKEKVFDAGGIDIAKGGFTSYVRDFISAAVQEAEIRGYQKLKNEIQKSNAKAKAKSAAQPGDSVQNKVHLSTADDVMNASKDDLINFMLK